MSPEQEQHVLTSKEQLLNGLDIQQSSVQRATLEKSILYFVLEALKF